MKAAYSELWDEESRRKYGQPYSDDLPIAIRKEIRAKFPLVISEAEPTNFGEE